MTDDSRGPGPSDSDAFLREIANAPDAAPAPPPVDLTGQTLGKYLIGARLGEGGMGVVYAATDTLLQRKVAFKVLSARLMRDDSARGRVLKEARSLAAVNHSGIALVYEVGELAGHVFIAMELVNGKTLRQHLEAARAGGGLPLDEVRRIVTEVARSLEHAHLGGVVHRDLKPENVMVTESGQVKILDFGLAKARAPDSGSGHTSTVEGHLVGTPGYMSPEQARGQPLDGRSDLFALGAVYYELVTGQRAFSGASLVETLAAIERDTPPSPRAVRPELSLGHEQLIYRCLEKKPEARFPSAGALVAALEAKNGAHAPRRRGAATVATLLAVSGVGAGAWWAFKPQPNPLASFDAIVACPQLAVRGVSEPGGWLGAAAAAAVCERVGTARWLSERPAILRPADLLDMPMSPKDDAPEDPFIDKGSRDRQLSAARQRAAAYVDGEVVYTDHAFEVTLELKDPSGATLARGRGTGHAVWQAVNAALEPLWGEGRIVMPTAFDEAHAFGFGLKRPRDALLIANLLSAVFSQTGVDEAFEQLKPLRSELGERWPMFEHVVLKLRGQPPKKDEALPTLDRSSPLRLLLTANVLEQVDAPLDYAALADELHAAASNAGPTYRPYFVAVEIQFRLAAHQNDAVMALALAAVAEHSFNDAWYALTMSSQGRPAAVGIAKAYAAWRPDIADSWNSLALLPPPPPPAPRRLTLGYSERAMLLAPDSSLYAIVVAGQYLVGGQLDQARSVGARLLTGSPQQKLPGEVVMLQVEAAEARFDAAYARVVRVLPTRERFGSVFSGDEPLVRFGGEMARVRGTMPQFAELVYLQLVAPEPVHLDRGPWGVTAAATICPYGEPKVALACTARLKELVAAGQFDDLTPPQLAVIDAAYAYARGQWAEAAAHVRRGGFGPMYRSLACDILDKAGDTELAAQLDEPWLERNGGFNGAVFAHVRAVRRAVAKGDTERAKKYAQRVVDAWMAADTTVPVLAEMRAVLAKP